jgi:tetratricopeptide (TPR) repeat protein
LEEAMLYPENLEVGKPLNDERNAMIHYFMGSIYKKAGNQQKARDCFEKSVIAENASSFPDLVYFQALSYEELGEPDEARALYQDLIAQGEMILEKGSGQRGIGVEEASNKNNKSISNAYYFQALGTEGLGEETKMKQHLDASLHSYKNNLWAKYYKSQW